MIRKSFMVIGMLIAFAGIAETVTINISGLRSKKGQLQISVFKDAKEFSDEKPSKTLYFSKSRVTDGKLAIKIDLPAGTYGITVLDDEDRSKDMSYRFGIYPTEGVGFSNYELEGMRKPKFSDFDFKITNKATAINVKLRYF